jgi:hypothetical protein
VNEVNAGASLALFESVLSVVRAQVMAEMQSKEQSKAAPQNRLLTVTQAAEFLGRTDKAVRQPSALTAAIWKPLWSKTEYNLTQN